MNAPLPASALQRSGICQQILRDVEPMQMPLDICSFNDDDIYVYVAATRQFVRQYGSGDSQVKDARHIGFRVSAGQTWAKGMAAKYLGLWSAA